MSLTLTSPAFTEGGEIPARYTCEGDDISPPLAWSAPPDGTQSLALIVDDPDAPDPKAPKMTWVHWVLYNLPPTASSLPEGVGREALAFVQGVGALAEAERHHPDICFGWGYARISLQTKKIEGLHGNDFIMAAKIDRLVAGGAGPCGDRDPPLSA